MASRHILRWQRYLKVLLPFTSAPNQGFPIGVSGVIVWHQPKQRIIIREIPQNHHWLALFDPPQNGWHLMTRESFHSNLPSSSPLQYQGIRTCDLVSSNGQDIHEQIAWQSRLKVETVGPLQTSTWWNPCTHECCQNAHEDEINKLSYHMMSLRANEDRCNLALILKAHICE